MARGKPNAPRLHAVAAWLAEHYPTPYPVTLQVVRGLRDKDGHLWGETYRRGKRQFIRIRTASFDAMLETLVHEWAHAVTLKLRDGLRPHDPKTGWGRTHAAIYSDLFDKPMRFKA